MITEELPAYGFNCEFGYSSQKTICRWEHDSRSDLKWAVLTSKTGPIQDHTGNVGFTTESVVGGITKEALCLSEALPAKGILHKMNEGIVFFQKTSGFCLLYPFNFDSNDPVFLILIQITVTEP